MFEQGEILIVPFPFSDLSSIKQRPVLILSKSGYNKNTEDIITCGITSHLKDSKYSVLIENKDLESGEIPTTSRIKVDKLFTIEKGIVKKRIGKVNRKIIEEVKKEFIRLV
ncbi:MAG: type II toxin-antitoxin system PemK/MazF family toxin [Nanoarchaeota archaeon]